MCILDKTYLEKIDSYKRYPTLFYYLSLFLYQGQFTCFHSAREYPNTFQVRMLSASNSSMHVI